MSFEYKLKYDLDERKRQSQKIISESGGQRTPLIIEKDLKSNLKKLEKERFMVSNDMPIGKLLHIIKGLIDVGENKALFLVAAGKKGLSTSDIIKNIYEKFKDEDGFLYLHYAEEEVFG